MKNYLKFEILNLRINNLKPMSTGNYKILKNKFKLYPKNTKIYLKTIKDFLDNNSIKKIEPKKSDCFSVEIVFGFKSKNREYIFYNFRPDIDNLIKGLLDLIFNDDSKIVELHAVKRAFNQDFLEIKIYKLLFY